MLLANSQHGPSLEMALGLLQKTQAGSLPRASHGSTSSLPSGMLLLPRTQHAHWGQTHRSTQVWDEVIGLEGVREDGFGLRPRPTIPVSVSLETTTLCRGCSLVGMRRNCRELARNRRGNNTFPKVVSQSKGPGCPCQEGASARALHAPEPAPDSSHLPLLCSATAGTAPRFAATHVCSPTAQSTPAHSLHHQVHGGITGDCFS